MTTPLDEHANPEPGFGPGQPQLPLPQPRLAAEDSSTTASDMTLQSNIADQVAPIRRRNRRTVAIIAVAIAVLVVIAVVAVWVFGGSSPEAKGVAYIRQHAPAFAASRSDDNLIALMHDSCNLYDQSGPAGILQLFTQHPELDGNGLGAVMAAAVDDICPDVVNKWK